VKIEPCEVGKPSVVRVGLKVPTDCRLHLREDSKVRIDKSLTGNISVLIGQGEGKPLEAGRKLKGIPAADFGAVTQKVNQVLGEAETLVTAISKVVKEIESRGDLIAAVSDISGLVKEVRSEIVPLRDQLRKSLSDIQGILEENRLDIRHTVANLRETSAQAKSLVERLKATPELLEGSLGEIEKAGAAVEGLLTENRAHLDTIIADLRLTSTNAANLTSEIKRRPWRLLYRPSEDELKAMDLYDAAWAYNLGATELNRSVRDLSDVLKRAEREGLAPGTLKDAEAKVEQSLRRHREAEEAFWERLRSSQ
jgi:chromosome segregation ATPase